MVSRGVSVELCEGVDYVGNVWVHVHSKVDKLSNQLEVRGLKVYDLRVGDGRVSKWCFGVGRKIRIWDCNWIVHIL